MNVWHCKENNIVCMAWTPFLCELNERWLYEKVGGEKQEEELQKNMECDMNSRYSSFSLWIACLSLR